MWNNMERVPTDQEAPISTDYLIALNEGIMHAEIAGAAKVQMDTADARALMDMARRADLAAGPSIEAMTDQAAPATFSEVYLVDGQDGHGGAFDRGTMSTHGIDNYTLIKAITNALKPFGPILKDGHGVALVMHHDGDASIIGVKKGGAA